MTDSPIQLSATIPPEIMAAVSKETSRYAMADVLIHRTSDHEAILAATDGRMLALRTCDAQMSIPEAVIPNSILRKSGPPIRVSLNGQWSAVAGAATVSAMPVESVFPPISAVMPRADERPVLVSLNAKLLASLAKAVSDDGIITLAIDGSDTKRPIIVEGGRGAGVIMPVKRETTLADYESLRRKMAGEPEPEPVAVAEAEPEADDAPAESESKSDSPEPTEPPAPATVDAAPLRAALARLKGRA